MSLRWQPRCVSDAALVAFIAFGASVVQCSSDRLNFEDAPDGATPPPGPLTSPDAGDVDAGGEKECESDTTQIYALSMMPDALYRFDPQSLTLIRLGYLDCPAKNVASMAVDRYGTAWIVYQAGQLVKVRLADLHCEEVVLRNKPSTVGYFGMGFAKDDSGLGETLFISNNGLFKIETSTLEVSRVGPMALPGIAELTGTGEGKLFAYSNVNGVVAQIEKTTGNSLETYRTSAVNSAAYAVAHWGGDFWIFASFGATSPTSSVVRYSPSTRTSTTVIEDTGALLVGAGSSTCAPVKDPG